jgi:peptidoglycan/LPS O-acetylase OafA/YrhL
VLLIFIFYKPQANWMNNIIFNTGVFLLMISAFKGRLLGYFFTRKPIYLIGGMCYSIYLLHYAFFHLVVKYTSSLSASMDYRSGLLVQAATAIPVVLLISTLFFILVERPCMDKNWPQRIASWFRRSTDVA